MPIITVHQSWDKVSTPTNLSLMERQLFLGLTAYKYTYITLSFISRHSHLC